MASSDTIIITIKTMPVSITSILTKLCCEILSETFKLWPTSHIETITPISKVPTLQRFTTKTSASSTKLSVDPCT